MKYFELERFLGKWYEIERIPSWYDDDAMCSYKIIQRCGRRIEFQHGFVKDSIEYVLHVNSTYTPGAEAVFDIQKNNIDPFGIPLSIITTDYTNYAIMYGCKIVSLAYYQSTDNVSCNPKISNSRLGVIKKQDIVIKTIRGSSSK
ncbi:biliverdin binding protein-I, partial [Danaus plexippus plexippus]